MQRNHKKVIKKVSAILTLCKRAPSSGKAHQCKTLILIPSHALLLTFDPKHAEPTSTVLPHYQTLLHLKNKILLLLCMKHRFRVDTNIKWPPIDTSTSREVHWIYTLQTTALSGRILISSSVIYRPFNGSVVDITMVVCWTWHF